MRTSSGTRVRCCQCKPRFEQAGYSSGRGLLGVRSQALVGALLFNGAKVAVKFSESRTDPNRPSVRWLPRSLAVLSERDQVSRGSAISGRTSRPSERGILYSYRSPTMLTASLPASNTVCGSSPASSISCASLRVSYSFMSAMELTSGSFIEQFPL